MYILCKIVNMNCRKIYTVDSTRLVLGWRHRYIRRRGTNVRSVTDLCPELAVLSQYYGVEIDSIDVQTGRIDRFGEFMQKRKVIINVQLILMVSKIIRRRSIS